ncbi:MAG: efflux transporter outer membrane subunit [Pseudomonadota bacterium]
MYKQETKYDLLAALSKTAKYIYTTLFSRVINYLRFAFNFKPIIVFFYTTIITAILFASTGCSYNPVDTSGRNKPVKEAPSQWSAQESPYNEISFQQSLLTLFNDQTINALVEEALVANADINALLYRLKAAAQLVKIEAANQLPQISLDFRGTRTKDSDFYSNNFQLDANISWEIDLWNKLGDEEQAASLDYIAQQNEFQNARNSLVARVIRSWIALSSIQIRLKIEHERLASVVDTETIIIENYKSGLSNLEDLSAARVTAEQTKADIVALEEQSLSAKRVLEILMGRTPRAELNYANKFPDIRAPHLRLPVSVLSNRPDIKSAFSQLQALDLRTRAAYKALLPSFNLSTQINKSNNKLSDLFSSNTIWSLIGGITQPIFQGGRIRADAKAKSHEAEAAWWSYKQLVFLAIQEVENTISREESLQKQQKHLQLALEQAEINYKNFQQRYANGLAGILDLLITQQQALNIKALLVEAQTNRLDNRIVLGLALGMGI